MIIQLIEILDVDLKEIMTKLMQNDGTSQKLMAIISAIVDIRDNTENSNETAIAFAIAS